MYDIANGKFTATAPTDKARAPGLRVLDGEVEFLKYVADKGKMTDFIVDLVQQFGRDYYWRLSDVSYAELKPVSGKKYYQQFGDAYEFKVEFVAPVGNRTLTVVISKSEPDYCDISDPDELKEWGCLPHVLACSALRVKSLSELLMKLPGVRFYSSSEHLVFTQSGVTFDILAN